MSILSTTTTTKKKCNVVQVIDNLMVICISFIQYMTDLFNMLTELHAIGYEFNGNKLFYDKKKNYQNMNESLKC